MLDNDIKTLIKILEESDINEIEVSTFWGRQKIRLKKKSSVDLHKSDTSTTVTTNQLIHEETINDAQEINSANDEQIISNRDDTTLKENLDTPSNNIIKVKAPLVGTFYRSAKPDTPPFISEGDKIEKGQIICIIEAMKIYNEIESEYSGIILKILIEDATPVEYDQDLLVISPE